MWSNQARNIFSIYSYSIHAVNLIWTNNPGMPYQCSSTKSKRPFPTAYIDSVLRKIQRNVHFLQDDNELSFQCKLANWRQVTPALYFYDPLRG